MVIYIFLTLICHMYMYLGIVLTFDDVAQKSRHAESHKEPLLLISGFLRWLIMISAHQVN